MKRLASCADAGDVVRALVQPADLEEVHDSRALPNTGSLPSAQRGIAEALTSSGVVFGADGKPSASLMAPEALERLVRASRPVAAFLNETGDVRRIYSTFDVDRPLLLEIAQFGQGRLLGETAVTLSRQLMYGATAISSGLSPQLHMVVPLRAAETTPALITGAAVVYDPPVGGTLMDALSNPMVDTRRAAARATCTTLRRLAAQRVYATDLTLEDVHLGATGAATVRTPRAHRLTSTDAVETIAVAMLPSLAGQAARVAGRQSSEEFLHAAFEVSDTPAWRTKTLRLAAAGLPSLERQGVPAGDDVARFCCALSESPKATSIPGLLHAHAPSLLARPDRR